MSSRTFLVHPKNRDLDGPEAYTQSNAKQMGFTPLFPSIWSLLAPKTRTIPGRQQRNVVLFPLFLRVIWIEADSGSGTEDGK